MQPIRYLPHIDVLLQSLRINRDRLNSKSKIAIDAKVLRVLLQALAAQLPFSEEFYRETYPDLADAVDSGQIPDLHSHFIEAGFFEGRFGAPPPVEDAYYSAAYVDVAQAVARGDVASCAEHYMRAGAAEGRVPSAALRPEVERWMSILRDDAVRV